MNAFVMDLPLPWQSLRNSLIPKYLPLQPGQWLVLDEMVLDGNGLGPGLRAVPGVPGYKHRAGWILTL